MFLVSCVDESLCFKTEFWQRNSWLSSKRSRRSNKVASFEASGPHKSHVNILLPLEMWPFLFFLMSGEFCFGVLSTHGKTEEQ